MNLLLWPFSADCNFIRFVPLYFTVLLNIEIGAQMKNIRSMALALAITTSLVAVPSAFAKTAKVAPLSQLVEDVKLPYESFTLDNGLQVLVHEDRKAPVVAVSIWYRVGSKHEPAGKTGFAHLFEHLMFNGSENAPNDFFEPLQRIGATDMNGTTWYDRTNYFQTVPTGALDMALFLESDRMGHLLGAVTQQKLDNQRGVVQNEKRQGDNAAYGMLEYEVGETLLPKGHPYRHSTIGSMKDLNSASMDDVRKWFVDHYAPNNAVLALAGDIDVATAKAMVNKWFGDIPRGKAVQPVSAPVVTLPAAVHKELTDMIPAETVFRKWLVPGVLDADNAPLTVGLHILGGLSSSRLDNSMVRKTPVAVQVSASLEGHENVGFATIQAVAKDGVTAADLGQRLDAEVADYLKNGPTQDEVNRAVTSLLASSLHGLDSVGGFTGKAAALAEGKLYSGDADHYVKELRRLTTLTPAEVQGAMQKWLSRPVFAITYKPGERTEGGENRGGADVHDFGKATPQYFRNPNAATPNQGSVAATNIAPDRSKFPEVQDLAALEFPNIERGRLDNGMEVIFARRSNLPLVYTAISFDAGTSADPRDKLGTQQLMLNLMQEGTKTLDSVQFAESKERLGASISGSATADNTIFTLSALKPNLEQSLALFGEFLRAPAFAPTELERVRSQQLVALRGELTNPIRTALRVFTPALYGPNHPYGVPSSGLGSESSLASISVQDVSRFHQQWIRPDMAKIFVVGDSSLPEMVRSLNVTLGKWRPTKMAKPVKRFDVAVPPAQARILLVDRPNAPQSVILAGRLLDLKGRDAKEALATANDVLGGAFLSRLNMNLRETKGWSYGASSVVAGVKEQLNWFAYAPVQADKTADSIREIQSDVTAFLTNKGTSDDELDRTILGNVRELPGRFETMSSVLSGIMEIDKFGRTDDYFEKLPNIYRNMKVSDADQEARKYLTSSDLLYVVVGDAKSARPQLETLDLPIETVSLSN